MSTQNVAGAGHPAVLRDSQSQFPNNQATVCEEIPNGSKVLRESLLGRCLRKFTKICFCHWLLCYWLIKCIPSNFDSELWNHLEFFHKLSFVWRGTSMSHPQYPLMGPTGCRFWVLTHRNSKCILSFGVECTWYPSLSQCSHSHKGVLGEQNLWFDTSNFNNFCSWVQKVKKKIRIFPTPFWYPPARRSLSLYIIRKYFFWTFWT